MASSSSVFLLFAVIKCLIIWNCCCFQSSDGLICQCTYPICKPNNTCTTDGVCYSVVIHKDTEVTYDYGCRDSKDLIPIGNPMWCQVSAQKIHKNNVLCCKEADFCNIYALPTLAPVPISVPVEPSSGFPNRWETVVIGACCCCVALIFGTFLFLYWYFRCRSPVSQAMGVKEPLVSVETTRWSSGLVNVRSTLVRVWSPTFDSTYNCSSNSAGGNRREGSLWRGVARQLARELVAVKMFTSREERSWSREAEIYQTVMLRHENILGFIAADNKDNGLWTQLWLITDFHALGSLYDHLNRTTVDLNGMVRMSLSIASGLSHLHMEIQGTQGKPGIAHCDLKSKNILVKNNGTCCIADLGLSIKHDANSDSIDIAMNSRVGTRRYMAPEVLSETIDSRYFESFKRADVYALGLVYWELVRRCHDAGQTEDYQLPYYNMVPSDPSHEEMRKVVVTDKKRPEVPNTWQTTETLRTMSQIMRECWYEQPAARLSALRIKKTLAKYLQFEAIKI